MYKKITVQDLFEAPVEPIGISVVNDALHLCWPTSTSRELVMRAFAIAVYHDGHLPSDLHQELATHVYELYHWTHRDVVPFTLFKALNGTNLMFLSRRYVKMLNKHREN